MKIVAETGNKEYFKLRAIEAIHSGCLPQAIQLLVLALVEADNAHAKAKIKG